MSAGEGGEGGGGRGRGLARRLRAALDARVESGRRAAERQRARKARLERARQGLLRDLEAFGTDLGHADVTASDRFVVIRIGDRHLRFSVPDEGEGVVVSGDGLRDGWRLQYNEELDRWGLFPPYGAVRPFFDQGLEELVRRVFGLHPIDDDADGEDGSRDVSPSSRRRL